MAEPRVYEIPAGTREAKCTGPDCGAPIFWIMSPDNPDKKLCLDPTGTSHWLTCKNVKDFSRRGK